MISVKNLRRAQLAVVLALGAITLTGCVVGPKYHAPAVPAPPAYKEVGDWKPAQPNDQNLGGACGRFFKILSSMRSKNRSM
jgi:hypothetical protein